MSDKSENFEVYLNRIKEKSSNYVYCIESVCGLLNAYKQKTDAQLEVIKASEQVNRELKKENQILREAVKYVENIPYDIYDTAHYLAELSSRCREVLEKIASDEADGDKDGTR